MTEMSITEVQQSTCSEQRIAYRFNWNPILFLLKVLKTKTRWLWNCQDGSTILWL